MEDMIKQKMQLLVREKIKWSLNIYVKEKNKIMITRINNHLDIANSILILKTQEIKEEGKKKLIEMLNDLIQKHVSDLKTQTIMLEDLKAAIEYNSIDRSAVKSTEFLNCPILLQLMDDPVITNNGRTYNKSALNHHFIVNGRIDPCTRGTVTDVFPNNAIKDAGVLYCKKYLVEPNKDYHNLHFT